MAITASELKRNAAVALTLNGATASQTVGYDHPDNRIALVVHNDNTNDGTKTATVTISKGTYLGNAVGDLKVDVGDAEKVVIGPLESVRFKNTASEITVGVAVTGSGTVSSVKIGVIKLP